MTTAGRVLLALAAVVAFAFLQLPKAQAAVLCKGPVKPDLDIAAAAAVPIFKGKSKTTIGFAAARAQAATSALVATKFSHYPPVPRSDARSPASICFYITVTEQKH
jgi:hypothetical protein